MIPGLFPMATAGINPMAPQPVSWDQRLMGMLNNPLTGAAIGLMQGAAPGGTLAGGMQAGLQNMLQQQRANQATSLMAERLAEMQEQRRAAQRQQRAFDQLYADPQARLAAQAGQMDVANRLQFPEPVGPMSTMGKIVADYQAGLLDETQFDQALQAQMKPMVQIGQRPDAGEAKQFAQFNVALDMLGNLEQIALDDPGAIMSPTEAGLSGLETVPLLGDVIQGVAPRTDSQVELDSLARTVSTTALAAFRGAQVGPQEQAIFERQLPMPGQDRRTFMANLKNTRQNLKYAMELQAGMRNIELPDSLKNRGGGDERSIEDLLDQYAPEDQ